MGYNITIVYKSTTCITEKTIIGVSQCILMTFQDKPCHGSFYYFVSLEMPCWMAWTFL